MHFSALLSIKPVDILICYLSGYLPTAKGQVPEDYFHEREIRMQMQVSFFGQKLNQTRRSILQVRILTHGDLTFSFIVRKLLMRY
jgi:hypothetical protein